MFIEVHHISNGNRAMIDIADIYAIIEKADGDTAIYMRSDRGESFTTKETYSELRNTLKAQLTTVERESE